MHLQTITDELGLIIAGADRVLAMFAEADQYVQRSVAAAGRGGFAAMVANLSVAQQQLRQLCADLSTTRGEAVRAAATVNDAPQQVDAGRLVTLLSPLSDQVTRVHAGLVRAAHAIPPIVQRVAASANRNLALGILDSARTQMLVPSVQRAAALAQDVAAALVEAEIAQSGGSHAGGRQHPEPLSATRSSDAPPAASTTGFDPEPYFAQMPRYGLRAGTRPKTHGRWTDHTGATHHLVSGRHDAYYTMVDQHAVALGLVPAHAGLARSGDVELKFAMRMCETWQRTGTPPRETIVINNPKGPCDGDLGCDMLLPRFLPPGGELTVYWPGGHKTYRGEAD